MLNAEYMTFTHTASQTKRIRTLSYSIPSELKGHIDTVHPGNSFDFGGHQGSKLHSAHFSSNSRLTKRLIGRQGSKLHDAHFSFNSRLTKRQNQNCTTVTPSCLQGLYGIPTTPATQNSSQLSVANFFGSFAQTADLSVRFFIFREVNFVLTSYTELFKPVPT
jgi:tripeptidyl-peptidase I